jgi:integrase
MPKVPKVKSEYVIDIRELNIDCSGITQGYIINLEIIVLPWLREITLSYIKYRLGSGLAWGTCRDNAQLIKRFGDFLFQSYPNITSVDIDRRVIVDFISSNQYINYTYSVKKKLLFLIKDLFEKADQFGWAKVSDSTLVYSEDYPSYKKFKPNYIPEEVMEQIMKNLPSLPQPFQRMIFILSEVGMRVSELLHLKFDCLMQDSKGDWFLKYYQFKMKKEHTVPIRRECAGMIQKQQQFIREEVSIDWEYLFCGRRTGNFSIWVPKLMDYSSFLTMLKKFVKDNNIIDAAGNLWNLHSHQFRHTIATRMINSGMAQHYVQKFLGHESSQMTQVYAHIHDQTLKKEFAKYQGKIVDIAGKVIEERNSDVDNTDLQWFKKNIQAQALPNGSCALPAISQGCPHANACLTCTSFLTTMEFLDQHKQQLKQTEEIIEKARSNGWTRQLEMNEKVAQNLTNIISSLERQNES